MRRLILIALTILLSACSQSNNESAAVSSSAYDPSGVWRAVLASPGGELPFTLEISGEGGDYQAVAINGEERAALSHVRLSGLDIILSFSWYDSEITARLSEDGSVMEGRWRKTHAEADTVLGFSATRGLASRFLPLPAATTPATVTDISGTWAVEFTDEDGSSVAQGEFTQSRDELSGTFLTASGDYRYLHGVYQQGVMRLSTYDGSHAFLFQAQVQGDGSLKGDFWSRDVYHATWTATRADSDQEILPDAWDQVQLTGVDGSLNFSFEDLDGRTVTLDDQRFAGKPVLINLFGSWCPNCNDEAPELVRWYAQHQSQGLEIIGLAFEYSGDSQRDREMIARYAERHGIEYTLLLAGTTDKKDAAQQLGFVDKVIAFPTTIFLDREHQVVGIHSGFAGPGTGRHHTELVAELSARIEALL
jgi:thiol-disulfide isomerase/thioredoxin